MAFATASSPANREPGDNAQTAAPPQTQARPRQSPGKAEPPACARAPSAPEPASACQSPQRMPEPPTHARTPARAGTKTGLRSVNRADHRTSGCQSSRAASSQSSSRAEQRVPAAKNRQLCPAAVKIDDSSQPQGQNTRLFALSGSPYANNRQNRPFLTSDTAKNRLF